MNPSDPSPAAGRDTPDATRLAMSALGDGELPAGEARQAVQRWADHAAARRAWREYQVIGDVLRSDELAGRGNEAAFLGALRERLAQEPVVIAPAAVAPPTPELAGQTYASRRRRAWWLNSAAVAAGFAAVAVVLVGLNPVAGPSGDGLPRLSTAPATTSAPTVIPVSGGAVMPHATPGVTDPAAASAVMIRDPRLDAYLNAHRQFGSGAGFGLAAGHARPVAQSEGASR
jgi:sigma-E factor negative regulatory protein RseA